MASYVFNGCGFNEEIFLRAFAWALEGDSSDVYLFIPSKKHLPSMGRFETAPGQVVEGILKKFKKENSLALTSDKKLHICFGTGPGVNSGSYPSPAFSGKILSLFCAPDSFAWLEKRCPNADFGALEWGKDELREWSKSKSATSL